MFELNTTGDVFGVAEQVLQGEIQYRAGDVEAALEALREAVRREDNLRYIEPPDWIQPVRHVRGATLLDAGRYAEAEAVYRADLVRHSENGWSPYGLAQALQRQEETEELPEVQARFQQAWPRADVQLKSSCYCLPGSC